MKEDELELVRGSGNVFADLGLPNPDIQQLKAILAARIIGILEDRNLSVRDAEALTRTPAADFSRIRRAKLDIFTIDRLMKILNSFDQEIEVSVSFRNRGEGSLQQLTL